MLYQFGPNQLNSASFELRRSHWRVRLAARPMELLLLLVSRHGVLVTREEIAGSLWPGLALEDLDSRINTAIGQIRAALSDDAARPRYLETVIGKGYRFIHVVKTIDNAEPAVVGVDAASIGFATEFSPADHLISIAPENGSGRLGEIPSEQQLDHTPQANLIFQDPDSAADRISRRFADPKRRTTLVAAMLVAVVATSAIAWLTRSRVPVRLAQQWTLKQITNNDSNHVIGAAAISPDGQSLAYADSSGVYLREMETGRTRPLQAPKLSAIKLVWFRDAQRLLLTGYEQNGASSEIWILSGTGAEARLFRKDASDGAPSPDGRSIAFTSDAGQSIRLADVDGGGERTVVRGNADRVFSALFWPISGRRLSYQQRTPSGKPGTEPESNYDWRYGSLDLHSLVETASVNDISFDSAAETSAGRLYFLRSHPLKDPAKLNGLWSVQTDPSSGAFTGIPQKLASVDEEQQTTGLSITDDGKQIAVLQEHTQTEIFAADLIYPGPALKHVQLLSSTLSSDYPHAWGGANDTVYFESNRVGKRYHIFRQRFDSSNAEMLSFGEKQQFFPAIMPDGKTLVYEEWADVNGQRERSIWRADADGTNASLVWKEGNLDEWRCPLVSGPGCILRETEGQRTFIFYALDLKTGKGRELVRTAWEPTILGDWALAPDGTIAAIPNHDLRAPSVRLVALNGDGMEREFKLQNAVFLSGIAWTADAQALFGEAQVGTYNQLQLINLNGREKMLRQATGYTYALPSRDGKRLAFSDSTIIRNVFLWH